MPHKEGEIFVFGSNLAGRHGKGAALTALRLHGAIYGRGSGRQKNSYAIPTKDHELKVLDIGTIKLFVDEFLEYAKAHPELVFNVTKVGCGLAGFTNEQIAPLFIGATPNCRLDSGWNRIIKEHEGRSGSLEAVEV